MILEIAGEKYDVQYTENPMTIDMALELDRPKWVTYDTETDGLHVKQAKPFLGAVAWDGHVYVFPTTKNILEVLPWWASKVERIYCHNTVFDMNMTANIIGDEQIMKIKNWGDSMCLARLIFEAVSGREGGDSLKLKQIAKKYIDPQADRFEKEIKAWLKWKTGQDRKVLIALLKGQHGWTMGRFEEAMNKNSEPIPPEVMETFRVWQNEYPEPTYFDVPEEIMLPYLASDVIYTNILVRKALPVVESKQQLDIMEEEFALIPVIFSMGRIGIKVDREYLIESGKRLDDYIESEYERLYAATGRRDFNVNQHAKIKEMYGELLGELPPSVDKKFMAKMVEGGDEGAAIISRLRTLEKWKSTYIDRILEGSDYDGRFYPSLDQFNPISGRFSGNLQQQPKKGIKHHETQVEIFHPRRAFVADSDEGYSIFLLDFSQVELRFQAHYTLPFGGDLNLVRAYMPFRCKHVVTGKIYRYDTEEEKARWSEQFDGVSAWIIPETGDPWQPTDVHSASTKKALGLLGIDWTELSEADFQTWRGTGKSINFAKNYGVGVKGAAEQFGLPLETAKAMCDGYNEAFPMVITYQKAVEKAMYKKGYAVGIYGRRYYLSDTWRFYKVANYLIQGSCAHDLKKKMLQIFQLLKDKKSKMLTCIHDEIIYRIHESEHDLIPQLKAIMEYTPKINIPIVSDIDYTTTDWSSKQKWKGMVTV